MNRGSTTRPLVFFSLFIVITAPVVRADDASDSATPTAPGCVIFLGGNGTRFENSAFDQRWITVNKTVSKAAIAKLTDLHYRIEPLFNDARGAQESFENLYRAMRQKQCDQVLELSHDLTMPAKPNSVPHLSFKVLVFHIERNTGDRSGKVIGEYEHEYPFDLTQEVMENLSLSAIGATIATDVDKAGVLTARGP